MRSRLQALQRFDPTNSAAFLQPVENFITQAFEAKREKDAYGWMAVVAMMRYPQGLWGLVAQRWDLRFFPVQHRVGLDEPPPA